MLGNFSQFRWHKRSKIWELLGTFLQKNRCYVYILWRDAQKWNTSKDTVQRKANIHDLATGQKSLSDASSHITK